MPLSRGRRYAIRGLLIAATVLAVAAIFAVWANRQLLNADNWSETSTELLADDEIRTTVSGFLVDEVYANVDVPAELERALPPRLDPLAGPAANGLRSLAQRTVDEALGRPRVQQAWENANRVAAQQFINVAEDKAGAVTTSGDAVVLDLRVLLLDVVRRLGLPGTLASRVPPDAGEVRIMSGDQVTAVQDGASLVRGLSAVLPALTIALLALAVWLARGRRRQTIGWAGFVLICAGAIVLVGRTVAGNAVVASLAPTDAAEPAAHAAWSIGTELLRDVAQASIVLGIPLVVACWLAGASRPAHALRAAAAPWLREQPAVAYGVAGLLLLLVVAWGPIHATRQPLAVALMAVLLAAGVAALRRQTAREFPTATVSAAQASLHARTERLREALRPAAHRIAGTERRAAAAATSATSDAARAEADRVAVLERLAALHDRGALDDAEFAAEKAHVLDGGRAAVGS